MTSTRWVAVSLMVVAIGAGTALDDPPAPDVRRHGEYYVLQGDFHVHAALGDGGLAPWELAAEARRRGLDVIAVTNHNQRVAALAAALRRGRTGGDSVPIVIAGQELTTPHYHLIAVGITRTIDWRLSAAEAIRAVHAQGGVAIAAHPVSEGALSWMNQGPDALGLLDGAEAAHPLMARNPRRRQELLEFYHHAVAGNASLAPIGASDFHWGAAMGRCRTFLFVREVSERGVLEAIRAGRTVAYDGDTGWIGDPRLASTARHYQQSGPSSATPQIVRLVNALALAGAFLIVLFK